MSSLGSFVWSIADQNAPGREQLVVDIATWFYRTAVEAAS